MLVLLSYVRETEVKKNSQKSYDIICGRSHVVILLTNSFLIHNKSDTSETESIYQVIYRRSVANMFDYT